MFVLRLMSAFQVMLEKACYYAAQKLNLDENIIEHTSLRFKVPLKISLATRFQL